MNRFDVIVVGGGHAGIEASYACSRMGIKTLLLTNNIENIAQMSCNPSIGGIGKGHLVKEIDALGGIMARAADLSGIQYRILNLSKGPAVQATRAQIDQNLYKQVIIKFLKKQTNLTILQQCVNEIIIKNNNVCGVITNEKLNFFAKYVILSVGTFLNGTIHIGEKSIKGGRINEPSSIMLANFFRSLGINLGRLKTGTPPRLDNKTIDYTELLSQGSDDPIPIFSFLSKISDHPLQKNCFITHTNDNTHNIIRKNINKSPVFNGLITGIGPRYCPSIEDKVYKFPNRTSHHIFLEPEGLDTNIIYPNGISTSLPLDIQIEFVRSIKGLEKVQIVQSGYAVEYDFFDPKNLKNTLETKFINGLFLAGQINGTTGYEEAAAQGLIAGINAALMIRNCDTWSPKRHEAYIGVMIDDLLTQGTNEPYRIFTSRAEYRLLLREDNADLRLTEIGYRLKCVDDNRYNFFLNKYKKINLKENELKKIIIKPNSIKANSLIKFANICIDKPITILDLLKRSDISFKKLQKCNCIPDEVEIDHTIIEQIENQIKYNGYIIRQQKEIERYKQFSEIKIPDNFLYEKISGLSNEVVQKLKQYRPNTIGQAAKISGITPAAISILLIYLRKT